jgi:HlyD family secretion protein
MSKSLFRKEALDQLSSPDELDKIMQVTSPRAWLSLLAIAIIIASALVWSIYGKLPTKVRGKGIMIKTGGVYQVIANGSGQITEVTVKPGESVKSGQIIARINQPALTNKVNDLRVVIFKLEEEYERTKKYLVDNIKLTNNLDSEKKKSIEVNIITIDKEIKFSKEKINSQKSLYKEGLITKQSFISKQFELEKLINSASQLKHRLSEIKIQSKKTTQQKDNDLSSLKSKIETSKRQLADLIQQRHQASEVICRYTGTVIDVLRTEGRMVNPGTPVIRLELTGKQIQDLEVVFYVEPNSGKKISGGMVAQISPSTVKKEEFGVIIGHVVNVSEFPSTKEGMMDVLSNNSLVGSLSEKGAPIQIFASLMPSSSTSSGYKWSSPNGPPTKLSSGTMCDVSVTIKSEAPILLVIPTVKNWLGLN